MTELVRWSFFDPSTSVTQEFEVNPNEDGSPQRKKNITTAPTAAPGGVVLMFEGNMEPAEIGWAGVLLTEDHYNMYVDWYRKRHQIQLTDDLGRQFYIYIISFDPKKVRSAVYPWKHTYSVKARVLDWQE